MKHIEKILKTSGIIKASPEDNLGSVIAKLSSSHDAAFIFDKEGKFHGVINPYYTLIKTSMYDGNTKVENALFHPPHISVDDSLERIVTLMNESKIHYLPVFGDKKKFLGITSARRVLAYLKELPQAKLKISSISHTQKGRVLTVLPSDPISKAVAIFKDYKTSKIVVTDKLGKLKGILSHYDLIPFLMAPGNRSQKGSRGEKPKFKDSLIKNYIKTTLLTLTDQNTVGEAINEILTKSIGSIILVNPESKPTGILTTRDILDVLRTSKKKKRMTLTIKHSSGKHQMIFDEFVRYVSDHIQENPQIVEAEILYDEEKNGNLFKIQVHLLPLKGKSTMITREGRDLKKLLQEIKDVVRRG